MPAVIFLADVDLDSFYHYTMDYLDAKYHQFPTTFEDYEIPEELASQMSSFNVMAAHVDDEFPYS